jgi:hypothetical protein
MGSAKKLGQFVLENKSGQVIRTFHGLENQMYLVLRRDTGRLEAHDDLAELNDAEVEYDVVVQTTRGEVASAPVSIPGGARLTWVESVVKTDSRIELEEENNDEFKTIFKYTAAANAGLLVFSLAVNFFFPHIDEVKETEIVNIVIPDAPKPQVRQTVQAVEKLQKKQIRYIAKKQIVKTKQNRNLRATSFGRTATNKVATGGQNINQLGALAALGGKSNAPITGGSLSLKNVQFKNGSGGGGTGAAGHGGLGGAGRGGFANALGGKGLLSASRGTGSAGLPSGGYGTRGKAGGQNGYGRANLAGGSDGYFQPLEQDAEVEGGLDRDQINEVIRKNWGQIVYCYERGLQTKPSLSGRVGMKWTIDSAGRVSTAGIQNSSLRTASVEGCLLSKLKGFRFPRPVGGVNVKVFYPFEFQRQVVSSR